MILIKLFEDTNDVVDTWSSMFLNIVDKHLPMKSQRVKYKKVYEAYILSNNVYPNI